MCLEKNVFCSVFKYYLISRLFYTCSFAGLDLGFTEKDTSSDLNNAALLTRGGGYQRLCWLKRYKPAWLQKIYWVDSQSPCPGGVKKQDFAKCSTSNFSTTGNNVAFPDEAVLYQMQFCFLNKWRATFIDYYILISSLSWWAYKMHEGIRGGILKVKVGSNCR